MKRGKKSKWRSILRVDKNIGGEKSDYTKNEPAKNELNALIMMEGITFTGLDNTQVLIFKKGDESVI